MKHFATCVGLLTLTVLLTLNPAKGQTPCSLDAAWDSDGKLVADYSRIADAMLVLPDGKLLVACNPFGDSYAYLKRYNMDGSVDATYGNGGQFTIQVAERRTDIDAMAYHDGNVYLIGSTTTDIGGTNTYVYVAATTANGAYVNTFGVSGVKKCNSGNTDFYIPSDIVVDANGGIYITGLEWLDNLFVAKLTATGSLDASWDGDGVALVSTNNNDHWWDVYDMEIDLNGQVVVAGKKYRANNGSTIPNFWHVFVTRFNANGSLDNSFANGGIGLYNSDPSHYDEAKSIMVTAANNYVTAGISYMGSDYDYCATGILHDGSLNSSFGTNGWSINDLQFTHDEENCLSARILPDGRILQTGNQGSGDTVHFALLMLNPDGSRDNTFAPDGLFMNIFNQNNNSSGQSMFIDPSGKVYMGGYTRTCVNGTCGPLSMAISRYNNSFGTVVGLTNDALAGLKVSPNPVASGGRLTLSGIDLGDVEAIQIMDVTGKIQPSNFEAGTVALPSLASGVYFLRVMTSNGCLTQKIVVE